MRLKSILIWVFSRDESQLRLLGSTICLRLWLRVNALRYYDIEVLGLFCV